MPCSALAGTNRKEAQPHMDGGIFLLQADNSLMRMNQQPYEAEELLQRLLADHSDLLAGDQINSDSPRRWLFIGREMGVPGEEGGSDQWSLDHLFIDQDAVPTFVEVKRSSDTRSRREVVAQMLDYAANAATYWPVSRMRERHASMCESSGVDAEEHILELIGDDGDIEGYWDRADQNLRSGRVRMLFVSDKIPPTLRRIVEFLNQQMNPAEVLALEVKQFIGTQDGNQLRTLVPRVIGQSEANRQQKRMSTPGQIRPLVSVEDFASLAEIEPYETMVEAIIDAGRNSHFEIQPYSTASTNVVRFVAPGDKGDTFAITTGKLVWVNFRSNKVLGASGALQIIKEILLEAFPSKESDIVNNRTGVGFKFDQVATEDGLAAVLRAIEVADNAIFGEANSSELKIEGGS